MLPYQRRLRPKVRASSPQNAYILAVMLVGGIVLVGQMFWVKKNQYRFMPFAIDRVKCEECGGTGLVPQGDKANTPLVVCPSCFGVGSHQFRRVDDRDVLCPACEGMGRVPEPGSEAWRTCRRCDGRGLIRTEPGPITVDPVFELQPSLFITNEPSSATNGSPISVP